MESPKKTTTGSWITGLWGPARRVFTWGERSTNGLAVDAGLPPHPNKKTQTEKNNKALRILTPRATFLHLLQRNKGPVLHVPDVKVTPGRLELPTNSLGNCCSIHLSYGAPR